MPARLSPALARAARQPDHCATCQHWTQTPGDRWMGLCALGRLAHGWHNGGDPDAAVSTHGASPCHARPRSPMVPGWTPRKAQP